MFFLIMMKYYMFIFMHMFLFFKSTGWTFLLLVIYCWKILNYKHSLRRCLNFLFYKVIVTIIKWWNTQFWCSIITLFVLRGMCVNCKKNINTYFQCLLCMESNCLEPNWIYINLLVCILCIVFTKSIIYIEWILYSQLLN